MDDTVKIFRTADGREEWYKPGELKSGEIKYYVLGPCAKDYAINEVWNDAPEDNGGLGKTGIRIDSVDDDGNYEISVLYGDGTGTSGDPEDDNTTVLTFESSSGTAHITKAIEQTCIYGDDEANGLIGWNGEYGSKSHVAGVDIVVASMTESYTKMFDVGTIKSKRATIGAMVGTVNKSAFKGWGKGELLLASVSFSANEKSKKVPVTFQFIVRKSEDVDTPGGKKKKEGHQYVSTVTKTVVPKKDGAPVVQVRSMFLNDVYQSSDFSKLGL